MEVDMWKWKSPAFKEQDSNPEAYEKSRYALRRTIKQAKCQHRTKSESYYTGSGAHRMEIEIERRNSDPIGGKKGGGKDGGGEDGGGKDGGGKDGGGEDGGGEDGGGEDGGGEDGGGEDGGGEDGGGEDGGGNS
ncbi:uncharacterized protein LOC115124662 [Oncorhynchus nerka]|uniref:uncharacterized protein LOC115124662 n=1 Tax=Oncorhynchus nerka TaxID=8023 RepID=UPI0031B88F10